jgi:hypothetical protein
MEHTHAFAGVAPELVYREYISSDFLLAFSTEVGVNSGELALGASNGQETADMPWSFPTNRPGIPSLAQKLLPGEVHLDWHQQWGPVAEGLIPGAIQVELHGTPSAKVQATARLIADGDGTKYVVLSTTKTGLRWPVAGKVESTIDKELVGWILQVQARVLRRRLGLPG